MASERDKTADRTTPVAGTAHNEPAPASPRAEIDAFIQRARTLGAQTEPGRRGRLIFALDATMSRQPTWDTACRLQGEMFREAGSIGGLDVQLVYFRGLSECRSSRWVSDGAGLGDAMEEAIDDLAAAAGELGLLGVPAFVFQEGHDPIAEQAFREIARLTRGAYCRFDLSAAHELAELLRAVAVFAAGGIKALADLSARRSAGARKLLTQMR
jgi:hypothetical protein